MMGEKLSVVQASGQCWCQCEQCCWASEIMAWLDQLRGKEKK